MNLPSALAAMTLSVSCFAYAVHLRRRERTLGGTPRSRLRSAAQGHVVLEGRGHPRPGHVIVAPFSGKQCVWWSTQVEPLGGDGKVEQVMANPALLDRRVSCELFLLDDGTGECLVDPAFADVQADRHEEWFGELTDPGSIRGARRYRGIGDVFRYREWRIDLGQTIIASGYLHTVDGYADSQQVAEATGAVLHGWKRDQPALLARFDANGDGEIDTQEWDEARRQARLEVMASRRASVVSGLDWLGESPEGGDLLLSTSSRSSMALQLRIMLLAMLILGTGVGLYAIESLLHL